MLAVDGAAEREVPVGGDGAVFGMAVFLHETILAGAEVDELVVAGGGAVAEAPGHGLGIGRVERVLLVAAQGVGALEEAVAERGAVGLAEARRQDRVEKRIDLLRDRRNN